jgi:hypothetical protein
VWPWQTYLCHQNWTVYALLLIKKITQFIIVTMKFDVDDFSPAKYFLKVTFGRVQVNMVWT